MTTTVSCDPTVELLRSATGVEQTGRAEALADRLERGARALATLASTLTEEEWDTTLPGDGRKVGVVVHHVATVYPLEVQLAQTVAGGDTVTGVTMADVHAMNAAHARQNDLVDRETATFRAVSGTARSGGGDPCTHRRAARSGVDGVGRPTLLSRVSSCSRITPCDTAITTSPQSGRALKR